MKQTNVLLLDNKDSFTYNIVDYLRRITTTSTTVLEANECSIKKIKDFDKIIISPGPGVPKDFPFIFELLEKYYKSKAIFGICLGHQAIGEFFGAKLTNIYPVVHGQENKIKIINQTPIYSKLPSTFSVGLYQSWAISDKDFPEKLIITALSIDNIIMSIEHKNYPVYGVQFHPESYITENGLEILKNFIDLI